MISPRTAILPVLLLLTSSSAVYALPAADNMLNPRDLGNLTKEQRQRLDSLQVDQPQCVQKCADARQNNSEPNYIPLCALNDQSTTEEENDPNVKNAYSCLCTDKVYVADSMACLVKNCGSNSTALDYALSSQYGMCKVYADINYPKPEVFLNDLCLLDDMPKGATVPTDVSLVRFIWPDYTFAKDFPKKTATTWAPSGTPLYPSGYIYSEPQWTCTPTPLADSESQDSTSTSGSEAPAPTSSNGTSKGNSTATTDKGVASSGRHGMLGMTAVVAAVAGLAIFL
ncbi:hypothetical protein L211DRAFT_835492 [Terfezia boudieri ATCC MYA-4762]|uniref:Extracellular membrane protein CFEM domain-containing protein n=1 Tax=Terfezia boudieri ATCC MYA-4762 TaxID=1051890 RepID=A0A3N4LX13_9PEZI|nr:hypothetical protein L211DRAFT_835492 [Terfezia boudieri ATCC MYA-4762]